MDAKAPFPLWDTMPGGDTYENFCAQIIPQFELDDLVPESIKDRFNTIHKLLQYSYYEYDFIDVAMERCYHTLELALHLRFEGVNPNKKGKMNFKPYLDWAVNNGYLNITVEQKKTLEHLRNYVTHLKGDRTGGFLQLNMIKIIGNDLINELFKEKTI